MHGVEASVEGPSLASLSQPRVVVNGSLQSDISDASENPGDESVDTRQGANAAFAELKQNLLS